MKLFAKLFNGWKNGCSTMYLTEQDGKDLVVAYYQKFTDEKIEYLVNQRIVDKIEELAKNKLHNKVMKKFIDKKANEIFNRFLESK
jgi:uncharacterized membrane-anchored protein YjiN (DUF445 family)